MSRDAADLTLVDINRIAREIARGMKPLADILTTSGIDLDQFDRLQQSEVWKTRMVEEAQVWSATTKSNLHERVATKAAAAIEELLEDAIKIIRNDDIPGAARVQALQFLAKMGQLGEDSVTKDDGSGRVQININIAGRKLSYDKETEFKTIEHEGSGEAVTSEVMA